MSWCDTTTNSARLALGSGPAEVIDDVLAQSPDGRYLVATQSGQAHLLDALLGSRVNLSELGADVRQLRTDYAPHRSLSFDAQGRLLAYLRRRDGTSQIVVRDLSSGSERSYSPGVGEVFRLRLSADARHVTFDAVRSDTNHNGRLDWPTPERAASERVCEAPALPRFRSFDSQGRGDQVVRGVVSMTDGSVRDVPELLSPLAAGLLVRESDGSLKLEVSGKRTPLAPADCAGRVLFADTERGLVLATCAPPQPRASRRLPPATTSGKREVWLFGQGLAKNLHVEVYATSTDQEAVAGARLVPLYPGSQATLVDLERRELLPLEPGSRVLTTNAALALIWRDHDIFRYDALTQTEERLAHGVARNPDLLRTGKSVLLSPFVIVGLDGPAWASPEHPLALTENGHVLTGSTEQAGQTNGTASAIQGPLRWVDARLPPSDGPPR